MQALTITSSPPSNSTVVNGSLELTLNAHHASKTTNTTPKFDTGGITSYLILPLNPYTLHPEMWKRKLEAVETVNFLWKWQHFDEGGRKWKRKC